MIDLGKRYARALRAGSLDWRCLLCNFPVRSDDCPHSWTEHYDAVQEQKILRIVKRT